MFQRYRWVIAGAAVGFVLIVFGAIGWLVAKTSKPHAVSGSQEEKVAVAKVGKLMLLPTGETPALVTVVNKNSIQNIPFLDNAQNGDQMLVYYHAKIAILYRPGINKIVNVGPVQLPAPPSPTPAPAPSAKN